MEQKNFKELLPNVEAIIFDVDGVLSSQHLTLAPDGTPNRTVNIKDGYALHNALKRGFKIAIITGGDSEAVYTRFSKLGMTDIYMKSAVKMVDFNDYIKKHNLNPENIMYMGDDIPDFPVMKAVGIPVCPLDAAPEIKSISKYISDKRGGDGCARDVIEQVMKAQGLWMDDDAFGW